MMTPDRPMLSSDELHARINQRGLMREWAEIVDERFDRALEKNKIGKTRDLANSKKFTSNEAKATFMFLMYGRYVDMGVGRGVNIGQVKEGRSIHAKALGQKIKRRPKKWYSRTLYGQVSKLIELIASRYGRESADWVANGISLPIVIEL